jgi:hypothetical protein
MREALERKLQRLRTELSGPAPTPLESLLVDRILACWLQVNYADAAFAQLKNPSLTHHSLAMRRQGGAQQRYLQAVKMLAIVRKLLPAVPPMGAGLMAKARRPSGSSGATGLDSTRN